MKRNRLLFLIALLVLSLVVTACTGGNNGGNSPNGNSGNNSGHTSGNASPNGSSGEGGGEPQVYSLPLVEPGTAELTVATSDNIYAAASYANGVPVFDKFEELTGVKIKFEVVPSSDWVQALSVRLAAGSNLPDLTGVPESNPVRMGTQGLLIPLNDLIDQYAPNIKAFYEKRPDVRARITAPDGNIYALSSVIDGTGDPYGIFIRQDWLDELGLKEPRTLDEWYDVLKAFKQAYPDSIPLSPRLGLTGLGLWGAGLGLHTRFSEGFYPDENGTVTFAWADPNAKELIAWLSKIYNEGLLDPNWLTNGVNEVDNAISRNIVGVTNHFSNNTNRYNALQAAAGFKSDWRLTMPTAGPVGDGFYEMEGPNEGWFGITKDADNPVLAIQWLDFLYASEEGNLLTTFGIEGLTYEMVNGEPKFTEYVTNNPDGLSFNEALRSVGVMPTMPWIRDNDGPLGRQMPAILEMDPHLKGQVDRVKDYMVPGKVFGLPTEEESRELASLLTDIKTYYEETLSQMVYGRKSLDEWDQYIATLQAMGLDRVLEIKQAQYDRLQAELNN